MKNLLLYSWCGVSQRLDAAASPLFSVLVSVSLTLCAMTAGARTLDDPLRWVPSGSLEVAGYVVHVGSQPGFRAVGSGVSHDIGNGYTLVDGVAHRRLGDLLDASAYVVMQAYDSAGQLSVDSNEISITIDPEAPSAPAPGPEPDPPPGGSGSWMHHDDFESYAADHDPSGWRDTAANNSMVEDDALFRTAAEGPNVFLQTTSTATNIHSHLLAGGSPAWTNYELAGRMRITDPLGGIGVTVYSDYASSDTYYRLRRSEGQPTFHLAPHPWDASGTCVGSTDSGVSPDPNAWYRFRFQATDPSGDARLRAKIWAELEAEPASWQIDCAPTGTVLAAGAPGVWSMGPGAKHWDDLGVQPLDPAPSPPTPDCVVNADCLDGDRCNGDEACVDGRCVAGPPPLCDLAGLCEASLCDPTAGCLTVPVADGTACDDGNICTSSDRCQSGLCASGGAVSCADPGPCWSSSCDPTSGCSSVAVANGTLCSDGDAETEGDACLEGVCIGFAPAPEPEPEPDPEPAPEPDPELADILFFEDFELFEPGTDPVPWLHTAADNSLVESPGLFHVVESPDGGQALGTMSDAVNIHSHYATDASRDWWDYDYEGRMRFEDPAAGVGVTILSDYPNSDSYLRLRRYVDDTTFRLSSHPWGTGDTCVGSTDSGVSSEPGVWYRFRLRTVEQPDGLLIQAKVWDERDEEPADWQISCTWSAWSQAAGRPGVWSMGPGLKLWDDLGAFVVHASEGEGAEPTVVDSDAFGYAEDFEGLAPGSDPAGWLDTDRRNSMVENGALFSVSPSPDGPMAFATFESLTNIHSHYIADGATLWSDYEYSGRMMVDRNSKGVGVTLYSGFPDSDVYYRLRRYGKRPKFHLSPHPHKGAPKCVGETETPVKSEPGLWYHFRFRAISEAEAVRLQARVWQQGSLEPESWQIDCLVSDEDAPRFGAPGVWSMRTGAGFWDDLEIAPIAD